jgi:hypothetical protein
MAGRVFWNVSTLNSDAGESLKRKNTTRNKLIQMLWNTDIITLSTCNVTQSICTYFVICLLDRAMAYSATTVLPADVWAATNTLWWSSSFNIACKTAQPFRNKTRVPHEQQDLRFFQQCGWGSMSSRIWHYVIGQVAPNTLKYQGTFTL